MASSAIPLQLLQSLGSMAGASGQGGSAAPAPTQVTGVTGQQVIVPQNPGAPIATSSPTQLQAPTFSSDTTSLGNPDYSPSGLPTPDLEKILIGHLKNVSDALDANSERSKSLAKNIQTLSYTPEQRAQEMYNKMFGISQVPNTAVGALTRGVQTDPSGNPTGGPEPDIAPAGTTTKRNWLQTILGGAGEIARGASEKGRYVPPMERFRQQAIQEYSAQAAPAMKELLAEVNDRRNSMNAIDSLMGTLGRTQAADQKAKIAEARTDAYQFAKLNEAKLNNAHIAEINTRIPLINSQADAIKLKMDIENMTKGLTGDAGFANQQVNDPKSPNYGKNPLDVYRQMFQAKANPNFQLGENGDMFSTRFGTFSTAGSGKVGAPGAGVPPKNGNANAGTKSTTLNNTGPKIPLDPEDSPAQFYGNLAAAGGSPGPTMKNTPEGRNSQNDATLFVPNTGKKLDAQTSNAVDSAVSLAMTGKHIRAALAKVPDSELGAFKGNLNKMLTGVVTTDPNLNYLKSGDAAEAISHLGAQRVRSGTLADKIANDLAAWGADRGSILQGLKGYTDQAKAVFASHPEGKARLMTAINANGGEYDDLSEIVNNKRWLKDQRAKALAAGGKAK